MVRNKISQSKKKAKKSQVKLKKKKCNIKFHVNQFMLFCKLIFFISERWENKCQE